MNSSSSSKIEQPFTYESRSSYVRTVSPSPAYKTRDSITSQVDDTPKPDWDYLD